jgi:benzoyl-CoA reductase subunit D
MVTAGIDFGARAVKAIVMEKGRILGRGIALTGGDVSGAGEEAFAQALREARVPREEVERILVTGSGRMHTEGFGRSVTEITADAKGAHFLVPSARTVIDVGAEEARAIKLDPTGRVVDFVTNDKCAAGVGAFVEAMARALEVDLEEMGPLSLASSATVTMNAQCVVFAESEVVSMVHARTPKPDMAKAIHDAIADRIAAMARQVGIEDRVVLIGGLGKNIGFLSSLSRSIGMEVTVPDGPEFVGAVGAALLAGERPQGA